MRTQRLFHFKKPCHADESGFTLAELLVVLAMISLLTTLVMVNFHRGEQSNDLRQAGTQLQQRFRLAQTYTIGGNSIFFCRANSTAHEFDPCNSSEYCKIDSGANGECRQSVPVGGYGVRMASTEGYIVFGDTDGNGVYDGSAENYSVIEENLTPLGIHLAQFALGNDAYIPSAAVTLDVTFEPPEGRVRFFLNGSEARDASDQPINLLEILVQSDYVSSVCRKVVINRISGQISESMGECSL
ncbi:MAG: prepilin-type N-terminal cleavage/methylation domain-containing protein [Patescibacteria group bacterium]|nr:prepilin-type N-terminal cleavage/methylation domain-containing protein [Patescibacteria group bacterium]MDD5715417.1 prepilin-type N-terminal cleavage/methylation domain-containing protein [Patescibacteria group bacterium]